MNKNRIILGVVLLVGATLGGAATSLAQSFWPGKSGPLLIPFQTVLKGTPMYKNAGAISDQASKELSYSNTASFLMLQALQNQKIIEQNEKIIALLSRKK